MNGILLDDNFELRITPARLGNGLIASGMVVGNIDYQRCRMIVVAQKGEFKEFPVLGFGIDNYLKSVTPQKRQQFMAELTKELKSDGMATAKVAVGDDLSQFEITL
jgi:hypothetical protein